MAKKTKQETKNGANEIKAESGERAEDALKYEIVGENALNIRYLKVLLRESQK